MTAFLVIHNLFTAFHLPNNPSWEFLNPFHTLWIPFPCPFLYLSCFLCCLFLSQEWIIKFCSLSAPLSSVKLPLFSRGWLHKRQDHGMDRYPTIIFNEGNKGQLNTVRLQYNECFRTKKSSNFSQYNSLDTGKKYKLFYSSGKSEIASYSVLVLF